MVPPATQTNRILAYITAHGPATIREIVEALDMHRASVSKLLANNYRFRIVDYTRKHGARTVPVWGSCDPDNKLPAPPPPPLSTTERIMQHLATVGPDTTNSIAAALQCTHKQVFQELRRRSDVFFVVETLSTGGNPAFVWGLVSKHAPRHTWTHTAPNGRTWQMSGAVVGKAGGVLTVFAHGSHYEVRP